MATSAWTSTASISKRLETGTPVRAARAMSRTDGGLAICQSCGAGRAQLMNEKLVALATSVKRHQLVFLIGTRSRPARTGPRAAAIMNAARMRSILSPNAIHVAMGCFPPTIRMATTVEGDHRRGFRMSTRSQPMRARCPAPPACDCIFSERS